MNRIYTGVGSRETPNDVCQAFISIANYLAKNKFTLRSGAAPGADENFEIGCCQQNGLKEIYLPWQYFNASKSTLYTVTEEAYIIAEDYFNNFSNFKSATKKLLARDIYQVIGKNFITPSDFVLCYTEGGKLKGGTATAIKIGRAHV